jgi:putative ABC transport system permease protein
MRLSEMLRTAFGALSAYKLRAGLSVLGIVIGVAAVVAIIGIVQGATTQVREQIAGLGMRTITITIFPQAMRNSALSTRLVSEELSSKLAAAPAVSQVVPTAMGRGAALIGTQQYEVSLLGVTPAYPQLFGDFTPANGRFLNPIDDNRTVAVLGSSIAETLFGKGDPVGKILTVESWGQKVAFTVVGVMAARGTVGNQDLDTQVYVPISTVQRYSGSRTFTSYIAEASSTQNVDEASTQIERILSLTFASVTSRASSQQSRGGFDRFFRTPYQVTVQKEQVNAYDQSTRTMMFILAGVAAISLLVGGIGIMNILLVSVTERTREIGIRMAIGARPREIRSQFLVEAVTICLAGGLIGLGLGWLATWIVSRFGDWPVVISVVPAVLAFFFSLAMGLTFGLYPALRAARMDPVEALRYE